MLPPRRSASSTIWVPVRVVVPRTSISWTKLEMPAVAGVSTRLPMRPISDIATTGAVGFSRARTVRPLPSVSFATVSAAGWAVTGEGGPAIGPRAASADRTTARATRANGR